MVSWLTSQFRARPKQQPKRGAPIASYTMGTDPNGLGGNARGDIAEFQSTFEPGSLFSAAKPRLPRLQRTSLQLRRRLRPHQNPRQRLPSPRRLTSRRRPRQTLRPRHSRRQWSRSLGWIHAPKMLILLGPRSSASGRGRRRSSPRRGFRPKYRRPRAPQLILSSPTARRARPPDQRRAEPVVGGPRPAAPPSFRRAAHMLPALLRPAAASECGIVHL